MTFMQVKETGKVGEVLEHQGDNVILIIGYNTLSFTQEEVAPWTLPQISIGNREGRHFSPEREKQLVKIVENVAIVQPTISNIKVWYDDQQDYQMLEFDLQQHHYAVRAYKIFTVTKDHRSNFLHEKNFNYEWTLIDFFNKNKQEEWDVSKGVYDLYDSNNHPAGVLLCDNDKEAQEKAEGSLLTAKCVCPPLKKVLNS